MYIMHKLLVIPVSHHNLFVYMSNCTYRPDKETTVLGAVSSSKGFAKPQNPKTPNPLLPLNAINCGFLV